MQNGQLRTHRQLRGWSQQDLVRELVSLGIELGERQLGVNCSLISRWEHGLTQPRAPYPKLLCQLFNTTAEKLGLVDRSPSRVVSGTGAGGGEDRFDFASTTRERWPDARLAKPVPDYGIDWHLFLPGGRFLDGSMTSVTLHQSMGACQGVATVEVSDAGWLDQRFSRHHPTLVVGVEETAGATQFFLLDAEEARRQLTGHSAAQLTLNIPRAYELDDLTFGLLWATANLDDALLADDLDLTESRRRLRDYETLSGSAVSREAAPELTNVSRKWLGSEFCARHILRNLDRLDQPPFFWTCEERGEEACMWLLFRHKYAYLEKTNSPFAGLPGHPRRAFCLPEPAVVASPAFERILLFLAAALMESLGTEVAVCTEPEYSTLEGFVLASGQRAVIANWVRSEAIWHVDTTARHSLLSAFADAAGHVSAHSAIEAADPTGRLVALASYLGLDWRWIRRRCRELSHHGCRGFARPRSRLLSVSGIDAACQYVAALDGEDSD